MWNSGPYSQNTSAHSDSLGLESQVGCISKPEISEVGTGDVNEEVERDKGEE